MLTNDQLRDLLREKLKHRGGLKEFSERYNVPLGNLSKMRNGQKKVSEKVMNILGYEWAIVPKRKK